MTVFQCPACYSVLLPKDIPRNWCLVEAWAPCGHKLHHYQEVDLDQAATAMLYTVGYSGKTFTAFLSILEAQNMSLVVDIRRTAGSHKRDFNKARLAALLQANGVTYLHLPQLGSDKALRLALAASGDYPTFFAAFSEYLRSQHPMLLALAALLATHQRIALLCTEARAEECHRSVVAEAVFTLLGGKPGLVHL